MIIGLLATLALTAGDAGAAPPPDPSPPPGQANEPQNLPDGAVIPAPQEEQQAPEEPAFTQEPLDDAPLEEPATSFEPMNNGEPSGVTEPFDRPSPQEAVIPQNPAEIVRELFQNEFADLTDTVEADVSEPGMIEFSGTVVHLIDKLRLGQAVADRVQEVMVVNRIEPDPPVRMDWAIAQDVRRALAQDEELAPFEFSVRVENQVVYLSGQVPAYSVVEQAIWNAAAVDGVRDVIVNRLETQIAQ